MYRFEELPENIIEDRALQILSENGLFQIKVLQISQNKREEINLSMQMSFQKQKWRKLITHKLVVPNLRTHGRGHRILKNENLPKEAKNKLFQKCNREVNRCFLCFVIKFKSKVILVSINYSSFDSTTNNIQSVTSRFSVCFFW